MNHEASSISAINNISEPVEYDGVSHNYAERGESISQSVTEDGHDAVKMQCEASKGFLMDLLIILDTLVYLELSTIYYME